MILLYWLFFSILLQITPSPPPEFSAASANLNRLAKWLEGQFDNADQMAALPDTIGRQPALTGAWVNSLCAVQRRVPLPELGTHVFYLEWREADCEGTINRQRIWAFRTEGKFIKMDFYSFKAPEQFANSHRQPALLANLTKEDLVGYPAGCTLEWRFERGAFYGRLSPATCQVIAQRSGRAMALEALIEIRQTGFTYRENGQLTDGGYAFIVPGVGRYEFVKRR